MNRFMRQPFILYAAIFFVSTVLHAQSGTVLFRGNLLYQPGSGKKKLKDISLSVDGKSCACTVRESGYFETAIPDDAGEFVLKINGDELVIAYPVNGQVLVPRDMRKITQVFVNDNDQKDKINAVVSFSKALEEFKRVNADIKNNNTAGLSKNAAYLDSTLAKMDDMNTYLKQLLQVNDSALVDAAWALKGKEQYYPNISASLGNYIRTAKDLRTCYINDLELIIDGNKKARDHFREITLAYTNSYERLDSSHKMFEQAIITYWKNKEWSDKFNNISNLALIDLHQNHLKNLSDIIIPNINRLMNGRKMEYSKEELVKLVDRDKNTIYSLLDGLDRQVAELLEKLKF